jgi:hypothetical protein
MILGVIALCVLSFGAILAFLGPSVQRCKLGTCRFHMSYWRITLESLVVSLLILIMQKNLMLE